MRRLVSCPLARDKLLEIGRNIYILEIERHVGSCEVNNDRWIPCVFLSSPCRYRSASSSSRASASHQACPTRPLAPAEQQIPCMPPYLAVLPYVLLLDLLSICVWTGVLRITAPTFLPSLLSYGILPVGYTTNLSHCDYIYIARGQRNYDLLHCIPYQGIHLKCHLVNSDCLLSPWRKLLLLPRTSPLWWRW